MFYYINHDTILQRVPDLTSLTSCGNIKLDGKIIASPFLIFNCSSDTINSPPLKSSFKNNKTDACGYPYC